MPLDAGRDRVLSTVVKSPDNLGSIKMLVTFLAMVSGKDFWDASLHAVTPPHLRADLLSANAEYSSLRTEKSSVTIGEFVLSPTGDCEISDTPTR